MEAKSTTTFPTTYGADLRARRAAVGLSRETLARAADCSISTIIAAEFVPSSATRARIEAALAAVEADGAER